MTRKPWMTLGLRGMATDSIALLARGDGWERKVVVGVSGNVVVFPWPTVDSGEPFGDERLNEQVRERARGLLALRAGCRS